MNDGFVGNMTEFRNPPGRPGHSRHWMLTIAYPGRVPHDRCSSSSINDIRTRGSCGWMRQDIQG